MIDETAGEGDEAKEKETPLRSKSAYRNKDNQSSEKKIDLLKLKNIETLSKNSSSSRKTICVSVRLR